MLSHTGHVMTLANSIIGVGILAMPFCFQKCGIFLSIFLLIVSNWITRICCHYLIKSSLLTRRKSFEFLGFHAFGSSGKLFVELCIIGYLLGTCITYFVVVGDLGPQIITKMFAFDSDFANLRFYFMLAVTSLCILPLAMLKNVDSLSAVCTASIGFYVCLVIKIILESESHILANDWTAKVIYWRPSGALQCLPIFSMALSCQMQFFEVCKSVNNQSVEKLNGIVRDATWICTLVYIAVGFFGYVAFCTQPFAGNILLNFSPSFGSDVIKIGFILSVAFSFPLVIFPCRASIYSLLYRKGHTDAAGGYIPETRFKMITTFIVGFTFCIALIIPSVELIIGLVGSTIGVAICVMFPAACFRKITQKNNNDRSFALSGIILVSGFCLMVLGTYANLQAIDERSSGAHLEPIKFQSRLISPTELPMIKEEVHRLLNDKLKVEEDKIVNLENPKLPQAEVQKEDNLNGLELQKNEKVDRMIVSKASSVSAQPPVMPVDEVHNNNEENVKKDVNEIYVEKVDAAAEKDKNPIIEMLRPDARPLQNISNNLNDQIDTAKVRMPLPNPQILSAPSPSLNSADIVDPNKIPNVIQQTIDKDAIKKDEEIAAEERNSKALSKNAEDELKKTQNELKKTKELLERKVDEIKEELAKQNKETQDLVVEKLEQVVEKVEKIEREVQKKDDGAKAVFPINVDKKLTQDVIVEKLAKVAEKVERIEHDVQKKDKAILPGQDVVQFDVLKPVAQINIPAEALNDENKYMLLDKINSPPSPPILPISQQNDVKSAKAQVYEPLSYKTGEIIEHARNATKLEHNLPLPLALLINASRIKPKDIEFSRIKNEVPPSLVLLEHQNLPQESHNITNHKQTKKENPENVPPSLSKENVEAIRRDILEFNPDKLMTTVKPSNDLTESQKRFKRSFNVEMPDFPAIDAKLKKENCLMEPKLETFLQHGSSGALDLKTQGIGRDLKSLQDESHEET